MANEKRMAKEILYVHEAEFYYRERPANEWIPITKTQYRRAVDIIDEKGSRLNIPEDMADDSRFLLKGHFIELNGPSSMHQGKNPRLIHIMGENIHSSETRHLIEMLDLPLPR